jgi:prepilin-type N-terminal cleavage/methylation domain-containing protein
MYISKKAFTLIELLAVVLIIGVLAAVALPQYQKAVNKTRAAGVVSKINTLFHAIERYALTYGSRPVLPVLPTAREINAVLDIQFPEEAESGFIYYKDSYMAIRYDTPGLRFVIAKGLRNNGSSITVEKYGLNTCWAYDEGKRDKRGQDVCQALCGADKLSKEWGNLSYYICKL